MSSYVLSRVLPEAGQRFQAMLDDLVDAADPRFTLAEVNDLLTGITRIEMPAALEGADSSRLPLPSSRTTWPPWSRRRPIEWRWVHLPG